WSGVVNWSCMMHWSSMVDWSLVLADSSMMGRFVMNSLVNGLVMHWGDSVVDWCSVVGLLENWGSVVDFSLMMNRGVMGRSDSLVVSRGAVVGTSDMMGFTMGNNVSLSLVLLMNWVLDVVHGSVVAGLVDVGGANVLSVV
ncbi:hypothetical protein, partial [Herbaspirillum sp.]|uniref:hypothetical protein n=1 Tax=Herbaspirillum sp. TaxID=1890675 RepID=UPI00259117C3